MHAQFLTVSEVADRIGVAVDSIRKYKTRGRMPEPDKYYGRTPVWATDTIDEWDGTRQKIVRKTD